MVCRKKKASTCGLTAGVLQWIGTAVCFPTSVQHAIGGSHRTRTAPTHSHCCIEKVPDQRAEHRSKKRHEPFYTVNNRHNYHIENNIARTDSHLQACRTADNLIFSSHSDSLPFPDRSLVIEMRSRRIFDASCETF